MPGMAGSMGQGAVMEITLTSGRDLPLKIRQTTLGYIDRHLLD